MSSDPTSPAEATSANRAAVAVLPLLFGLGAGPAAWVAQLIANYALASEACYPADQPGQISPPPGWNGEHLLLAAINAACFVIALVGFAVALSNWRRAGRQNPEELEGFASVAKKRSRFLGKCGMFAAAGFATAILFDAIEIWLIPACWSIS